MISRPAGIKNTDWAFYEARHERYPYAATAPATLEIARVYKTIRNHFICVPIDSTKRLWAFEYAEDRDKFVALFHGQELNK